MRVGIGSRDTNGSMHYPGMRSLCQSPPNFQKAPGRKAPSPSPQARTFLLLLLQAAPKGRRSLNMRASRGDAVELCGGSGVFSGDPPFRC
uniref:Uncharacterized protein n=1 Tax=Knipowitschia caucasica TaxID=637954 RepID=A0AAV2MK59_KNICA